MIVSNLHLLEIQLHIQIWYFPLILPKQKSNHIADVNLFVNKSIIKLEFTKELYYIVTTIGIQRGKKYHILKLLCKVIFILVRQDSPPMGIDPQPHLPLCSYKWRRCHLSQNSLALQSEILQMSLDFTSIKAQNIQNIIDKHIGC